MKKGIHPETRLVIFEDAQSKRQFLIESTIKTSDEGVYEADGKTYPKLSVEVTSDTHPFYTGQQTFIQAAGRVEKFNRRYGINQNKKENE